MLKFANETASLSVNETTNFSANRTAHAKAA